MHSQPKQKHITFALALIATLVPLVQCGALSNEHTLTSHAGAGGINLIAELEAPAVISDEDQALMYHVRHHIDEDFTSFKTINEVHAFLDKVNLLVQKHPKNVAFAQGDLKDLEKFLTQEIVVKLVRIDTRPFSMPISDDMMPIAQRAIDEDELTRKLFSGPLRSLIEAKRQQVSRVDDNVHRENNFFSNFWCKISGNCTN